MTNGVSPASPAAASPVAASTTAPASSAAASTAAPAASTAAPAASATAPAASATATPAASYIGDQAAIDIALQNAGFAANNVTQLEVELDLDDPVIHYDVNFKQGGMEYDYDINAVNGSIVYSHSEVDD